MLEYVSKIVPPYSCADTVNLFKDLSIKVLFIKYLVRYVSQSIGVYFVINILTSFSYIAK